MSRAETLYASAYATERVHEVRMRQGARKPIFVDLNGVLPDGVTVLSVAWDAQCQGVATIDTPAIAERSFSVWTVGANEGKGEIEATATTSDGQVMVFRISVWVQ